MLGNFQGEIIKPPMNSNAQESKKLRTFAETEAALSETRNKAKETTLAAAAGIGNPMKHPTVREVFGDFEKRL